MKSVLISVKPKWCELISSGKKTIEVRKTRPKLETPFKCYIYETKGKSDVPVWMDEDGHVSYETGGEVIGEFVCDAILSKCESANADIAEQQGLVKREKLFKYSGGKELYGWHISDLIIYDEQKELSEFRHCGRNYHFNPIITKPPQSWCYVEEMGR